jgi:sulfatase maturation enzyme AslB (radical SAM superfamily)
LNVLVSNSCNRRCPYCFAAERVSYTSSEGSEPKAAPRFISVEDFDRVVEFAARSRVGKFGILGGEPSTHPRFPALLERALQKELEVKVFTNGLWRARDIEAVGRLEGDLAKRLTLVVNVNQPEITQQREQERQRRLLEALGRMCVLSFNVYDVEFDPLFLIDLILRFKTRRHIRLGVAQPLAELESEHVGVERYGELSPRIMKLVEACDEHDIAVGFDCGFTLCMFTPEQIGRLQLAGSRFKASCGPAVDVGTDLSIWSCFPLSTFAGGASLTDFENVEQVVRYFQKQYERLYWTGAMAECVGCKYLKRRQCPGGCAAHVYRKFDPCA